MIKATYLGMNLTLTDLDAENVSFFGYCAARDFRLQRCSGCRQLRYPPTTGCPWCAEPKSEWVSVEGRGTVHSYTEVHHPVQAGFKTHLPYLVLIVDLDTQKGSPSPSDALRVVGNLVDENGLLASPGEIGKVGIGTRVRLAFADIAPGLALPHWALDKDASQPAKPWRYAFTTADTGKPGSQ
jgi:uncharacterized protein